MTDLIKFLFSKKFVLHLLLAILVILGCFWYLLRFLDDYTLHGETITVPNYMGMKIQELDDFSAAHELRYVIVDSVFRTDKPKGTVTEQHPKPESQVKHNRKVYLTVNAFRPPMVKLPNVVNLSLRQASSKIESYNLKLDRYKYEPAPCTNCVIRVDDLNGDEIEAGTALKKNTKVVLVLGMGASDEKVPLPCLLDFTKEEAKEFVKTRGVNIGATPYENCLTEEDSMNARIYKQFPKCDTIEGINLGGTIDIFLTGDSTKWLLFTDSLNLDTL